MFGFSARRTKLASVRGFTLIELLVVLAILAMLAGLVGPKVIDIFDKQKPRAAAIQISDIERALDMYKLDVGRYPTTEEGLEALVKKPGSANGWSGPYLGSELPPDPWGHPYRYTNSGAEGIEIVSLGADGASGGEGTNADISNRKK